MKNQYKREYLFSDSQETKNSMAKGQAILGFFTIVTFILLLVNI